MTTSTSEIIRNVNPVTDIKLIGFVVCAAMLCLNNVNEIPIIISVVVLPLLTFPNTNQS